MRFLLTNIYIHWCFMSDKPWPFHCSFMLLNKTVCMHDVQVTTQLDIKAYTHTNKYFKFLYNIFLYQLCWLCNKLPCANIPILLHSHSTEKLDSMNIVFLNDLVIIIMATDQPLEWYRGVLRAGLPMLECKMYGSLSKISNYSHQTFIDFTKIDIIVF